MTNTTMVSTRSLDDAELDAVNGGGDLAPVIRRTVWNYLDAQEDRLMEMCTRMSQERYGVY